MVTFDYYKFIISELSISSGIFSEDWMLKLKGRSS